MRGVSTSKPLQIFRAGRHVASDGTAIEFTAADLEATARAYDPAKHEAPIVVGHPKTDSPAYGWVKSLAAGDGLQAEPHQVDAAFSEMVAAGRFKKISAAFYAKDAPQNPVPGVYYLRHVGFLGAQPPAVKGLRAPQFAADEAGVIEFADWADMQNANLWRTFRDWFIGKFGLDEANKAVPDFLVQTLEDSARAPESEMASTAAPAYAEQSTTQGATMTPEQIAAREAELRAQAEAQTRAQAELDARAAQFAERESRIAADEAKRARSEIAEFVGGLVKAGKVLPLHQEGLVAFMAAVRPDQVVEFGEGDGKVSKPGAAWLRDYLQAQPKLVDFRERAGGEGAEQLDTGDANAIAKAALEFQEAEKKAGREISIVQAVQYVTAATR